ncbi:cob(I)yrinic acid a,c-diamide adenosyltransferase [Aneurinibacillus terranovensis]|uniref:cob(I)yrinic acid a,c-diamide adenosyltransferase n=1 Tax=Aneurinibacillus terranovensis TaxID=278991 RepID=UPI003CCBC9C7
MKSPEKNRTNKNSTWLETTQIEEVGEPTNMGQTDTNQRDTNQPDKNRGLTLVYTGDGKGKTTAALGLAVRAAGRGKRVLFIQFIKSPERTYGEKIVFDKLGIEICQKGIGFTWLKTPEEHRVALQSAWQFTKEKVLHGDYDVVILDEINNALAIEKFPIDDVLPLAEVLDLIRSRPHGMHLVLTGRSAKQEIIEIADLVTEMKPVKHYYDEGIPAVLGIEF